MLRARSELFRAEVLQQANAATFLRVEEVPEGAGGLGEARTRLGYSEFRPQGPERDALFKNLSITKMREEIEKGEGEFAERHWCLCVTRDMAHPVITADNAVVLVGFGIASREEAVSHPDTLLVFPLCWQACLVGRIAPFEREMQEITPSSVRDLYAKYLNDTDSRFAYSPTRVP